MSSPAAASLFLTLAGVLTVVFVFGLFFWTMWTLKQIRLNTEKTTELLASLMNGKRR